MHTACGLNGHSYFPLKSGYFKRDGGTTGLGQARTDQSIQYTMLCCSKCGITKEVISADHRKKEKED